MREPAYSTHCGLSPQVLWIPGKAALQTHHLLTPNHRTSLREPTDRNAGFSPQCHEGWLGFWLQYFSRVCEHLSSSSMNTELQAEVLGATRTLQNLVQHVAAPWRFPESSQGTCLQVLRGPGRGQSAERGPDQPGTLRVPLTALSPSLKDFPHQVLDTRSLLCSAL